MIVGKSLAELHDLVKDLQEASTIALDVESSGLDPYTSKLLLVQIEANDNIYIIDAQEIRDHELRYLFDFIEARDIEVIGHNIKFDIKFIYHNTGILLTKVFDTMVAESILTAGVGKYLYSLADLAQAYLGVELEKDTQKKFIGAEVVTQDMLVYAANDVKYLQAIKDNQENRAIENRLVTIFDMEMRLVPVVMKMEYDGVLIDKEGWLELEKKHQNKVDQCEAEVRPLLWDSIKDKEFKTALDLVETVAITEVNGGSMKAKFRQEMMQEITDQGAIKEIFLSNFNIGSYKQLQLALNLAGIPVESTDKKVLKDYKGNPIIDSLLDRSEYSKLVSTYGKSFVEAINPITGRIHTDYNQTGTVTGRWASSDPNLQNIPGTADFRNLFIARPDHKLVICDYCLDPETKILRADDLRWIPIKDLKVGDNLVGIDENSSIKNPRKLRKSKVIRLGNRIADRYKITTENGKEIIASDEHPWLVKNPKYQNLVWKKTKDLDETDSFIKLCDTWEDDLSYESGYLSGIYDGEGSLNVSRGGILSFYQVKGEILDLTIKFLHEKGLSISGPYERQSGFNPDRTSECIYILGIGQILKFLGSIRPKRLLPKHEKVWINKVPYRASIHEKISSIEFIGRGEVISMETSTHTFVAEGFFSHNSQQELRYLGAVSREPKLIKAYQEGQDIHALTASLIFGVDINDVTKDQRFLGKTINFAVVYGTTAWGLHYNLGIPIDEAEKYLNQFFTNYNILAGFIKSVGEKVVELKYSRTPLGRIRYFEDKKLFEDWREKERYERMIVREGVNMVIQGGSADMLKLAMLEIFYNLPFPHDKFRLLLQVHDEVVAEVHESIAEEARDYILDCMERVEEPLIKPIPAKADWVISDYWTKG